MFRRILSHHQAEALICLLTKLQKVIHIAHSQFCFVDQTFFFLLQPSFVGRVVAFDTKYSGGMFKH